MAESIHDRLQIETNIKLTSLGIDVKDIKQSTGLEVPEVVRKRVLFGPNATGVCGQAKPINSADLPHLVEKAAAAANAAVAAQPAKKQEIVLIAVRLAKVDANKGVRPVFVNNKAFSEGQVDEYFVLEGEGAIAFWGTGGRFGINPTEPLWVFNPNKTPVYLDIFFGLGLPPT